MGSSMRKAMFTEVVVRGLENWHRKAKRSLAASEENSRAERRSISLHSKDDSVSSRHSASLHTRKPSEISSIPENDQQGSPKLMVMSPPSEIRDEGEQKEDTNVQEISRPSSASEITSTVEESNSMSRSRNFDGEISFGSSWKNMESSRGTGEIASILEEDDSDTPEFIP